MISTTRRGALRAGALALGGITTGAVGARVVSRATTPPPRLRAPWHQIAFTGADVMDNQILWYLSHALHGLSDIGECLDTASRIGADDEVSWFGEWWRTAERLRGIAERSLERGHRVSAGEASARAANYYRAATMHYTDRADPRMLEACAKSVACFERSNELLGYPAEPLRIPYEGSSLPGYFVRSPIAKAEAPLLVMHQGFHAWPEEAKWVYDGALRRGYHCLVFHGPGQGLALRQQGLTYRADWENVVSPVIDAGLRIAGVDPRRIALMGLSFGGSLAPRAAAFERRIKLCIANPGVLNWNESIGEHFEAYPGLHTLRTGSPAQFDALALRIGKAWPTAGWWFRDAMWKHGARSPSHLFELMEGFNNEPIAARITCKTLIMEGVDEVFTKGQAKKLFDALRCPKEMMVFTEEDTGQLHCQAGALGIAGQRLFDWLDENL